MNDEVSQMIFFSFFDTTSSYHSLSDEWNESQLKSIKKHLSARRRRAPSEMWSRSLIPRLLRENESEQENVNLFEKGFKVVVLLEK